MLSFILSYSGCVELAHKISVYSSGSKAAAHLLLHQLSELSENLRKLFTKNFLSEWFKKSLCSDVFYISSPSRVFQEKGFQETLSMNFFHFSPCMFIKIL